MKQQFTSKYQHAYTRMLIYTVGHKTTIDRASTGSRGSTDPTFQRGIKYYYLTPTFNVYNVRFCIVCGLFSVHSVTHVITVNKLCIAQLHRTIYSHIVWVKIALCFESQQNAIFFQNVPFCTSIFQNFPGVTPPAPTYP